MADVTSADVAPADVAPADVAPVDDDVKESKFVVEKVAITKLRSLLSADEIALLEATEDKKNTLKENKDNIQKLMAKNLYLEEILKRDGVAYSSKDDVEYLVTFLTVTYQGKVMEMTNIISSKTSLSDLKEKACRLFDIPHKEAIKKKFFVKLGDNKDFTSLAKCDGKNTIGGGLKVKHNINIQEGDLLKIE